MGGPVAVGRGVLSLAVGLLAAGWVAAQPGAVAPSPPNPFTRVQAQDPPPVLPRSTALPPPAAVPTSPTPTETLTTPVYGEPLPPLPGSTEDQYAKELDARRQFQYGTWRGTTLTAFPNSLLWEPPLAVKKDPRMQLLYHDLPNYAGGNSVDTAIGMTMGLYRAEFEAADFAAQLDIFGVALTRFSPDDLMLADYRFGLPLTFRWGWWQARVAYEHTSAHLGDELIRATGRVTQSFAKDEVVLGLGRFLFDNLRVYGQFGYAFSFQVPGLEGTTREKMRFDFGAEWFLRCPTGWAGTPFAAANVEYRGDQQNEANYTFQAGWLWRNPTMRLGNVRVFVERYDGRSVYGQTIRDRERFTSVGFGFAKRCPMPRLVLGSRNKKKLGELLDLLGDLGVELTDLSPYPHAPEVDETGTTFEENARLKATQLAPALGEWVLGEDSGLCVPALGGAPGVYSARYAGTHGDDAANNAKLLAELAGKTGDARAAYYVSTAALATPAGEVVAVVEGRCWGVIGTTAAGAGGFGYDPLFIVPEYHASFGQLSGRVKHALSHRGRAVAKLRPVLRKALGV